VRHVAGSVQGTSTLHRPYVILALHPDKVSKVSPARAGAESARRGGGTGSRSHSQGWTRGKESQGGPTEAEDVHGGWWSRSLAEGPVVPVVSPDVCTYTLTTLKPGPRWCRWVGVWVHNCTWRP